MMTLLTKTCSQCKVEKTLSDFNARRRSPDGVTSSCTDCIKERERVRRASGRTRPCDNAERQRKYRLKARYGLSEEQYDEMREAAVGCAICGVAECRVKGVLSLDHDHATGAIREFLCDDCNNMLGRAHDDADVLEKAAAYLRKHKVS